MKLAQAHWQEWCSELFKVQNHFKLQRPYFFRNSLAR